MIKWLSFSLICLISLQALAADSLETIEVTSEGENSSFSGFWEENKGTQIFSGKKNTITDLKQIPQLQTNNYRQATSQTPGLLVSEIPNEALAALTYRGLGDPHESYNLLLLQDGIPVAADMYGYPAHYYSPALPMMEKVQFIRGGAGLLFGPQPGGVLNYTSRPLQANQETKGHVGLTYGSYDLLISNNAIYGSKDNHAYGVEYYRRQGDGPQRVNSDFYADYVQVRDHIFAGANTFKIDFNGYNSDHGESGGFAKEESAGANVFGDDLGKATKVNDRLKVSRAQLALSLERALEGNSRLEATLWGNAYRRYSKRQNGAGFGIAPTGGTNQIVEQLYYGYNGQVRYLKNYSAMGGDHTFSGGFLTYNLVSPITVETGAAPDSNSGTVTSRSERITRTNSFFAENRFSFGNLMITPGVRLENITQSIEEKKGNQRENQRTENVPLFGLGLSYHATDASQVYANISEAYKPLTWAETLPSQTNQTVSGDIEEAKTLSSEIGYRGQTELLNWDASVFHIRYENRVGTVGTTITNVGAATHQGVDLATELKLSRYFTSLKPMGDFNLYANIEVLDAKFTRGPQEGKTPQYAPKTLTRTGLIYSKENKVKIAFMGTFVGAHYANDNNTDQFEVPSYTVFDLTADYSLNKNWKLSAGINNLFDREYYSRVRSDGVIWALDRNYYAGATYQF